MTTLFRPVGLDELSLIWDSGMREFPPRLPHQPIFYPVTNVDYATQIARDWNTKEGSLAGYVTEFEVDDSFISAFEPHTVGSALHKEYWIPAEQLSDFNAAIHGTIRVHWAYFGQGFQGFVPDHGVLKGKTALAQFTTMMDLLRLNRQAFAEEVILNQKAMSLNFMFWAQLDSAALNVDQKRQLAVLEAIRQAWESDNSAIALPE
jgi:hypothetical protein